ncbi:hypothetical protein ACFW1A_38250, partial [Kitasatospora sp. NPDC058965]|uniref:hypothetical protein n=1 Tax=Kitasatospora sp. NPDC058965 TaxID=3346682 RepID=UPI003676021E
MTIGAGALPERLSTIKFLSASNPSTARRTAGRYGRGPAEDGRDRGVEDEGGQIGVVAGEFVQV